MIGNKTIPALVSHAASAKPCIPHNDAQRGHGDSNPDHEYVKTFTYFESLRSQFDDRRGKSTK